MREKTNTDVLEDSTQDWHRPEIEEDPDNAPEKFSKPPRKYESGFLLKLDARTEICKQLREAYTELTNDLGGEEVLSKIKRGLCERYIFLEFILQQLELKMAENPQESSVILSRWIQACNSILGLARTLGLERKAKQISLKNYIQERKQ